MFQSIELTSDKKPKKCILERLDILDIAYSPYIKFVKRPHFLKKVFIFLEMKWPKHYRL